MNFLNILEQNSTINNTKGGKYYSSTYDCNLDLFVGVSRFNNYRDIITKFNNAYVENRHLALANLLYYLDIREGKGERKIFKIIFRELCKNNLEDAKIIMSYIGTLGRYDYVLEGLYTNADDEVINLIRNTLNSDLESNKPSLLAKWLPSHCTHGKSSLTAKYLCKRLNIKEKEYRKILSNLRTKINIVEKNLSNKTYDNIIFEEVPTKAMLKYSNTFSDKMRNKFNEYKKSLIKGETKINTNGLFCYEIIKKIEEGNTERDILNVMWDNQKIIDTGNKNILVVADTSGSMMYYNKIPYASAIGLAIYTAEHNNGIFKNSFITFSNKPLLQKIKGKDIVDKCKNINPIVENTNIDKVFELLLKTMKKSKASIEDLPSHIILISDMEFDEGVYSNNGTNFNGWKKEFLKEGYVLPKIIFWNVAGQTNGFPVTKNDNDCIMISGFSTNLLEYIFHPENFNPVELMNSVLNKYVNLIKDREN